MTYVYKCKSCGHRFEVDHGMTEEPEVLCPSCKALCGREITGGAGFLFNGKGFYTTDNRTPDYYQDETNERQQEAANSESEE